MYVLLITRLLLGVGRWVRKPVNHTSWVAIVTPTDRPKSVRNRCLIELFVALFVLSLCPFDISVGEGVFVIGLSQISSFLSVCICFKLIVLKAIVEAIKAADLTDSKGFVSSCICIKEAWVNMRQTLHRMSGKNLCF